MPRHFPLNFKVDPPDVQIPRKENKQPAIVVSQSVWFLLTEFCRQNSSREWSCYGIVIPYNKPGYENVFYVPSVVVSDELWATSGSTDISPSERIALSKYMNGTICEHFGATTIEDKCKVASSLKLWIHSHHTMGVFWSSTDDSNIAKHSGFDQVRPTYYLSLVVNNKMEFKALFSFNTPVNGKAEALVFIHEDVEKPEVESDPSKEDELKSLNSELAKIESDLKDLRTKISDLEKSKSEINKKITGFSKPSIQIPSEIVDFAKAFTSSIKSGSLDSNGNPLVHRSPIIYKGNNNHSYPIYKWGRDSNNFSRIEEIDGEYFESGNLWSDFKRADERQDPKIRPSKKNGLEKSTPNKIQAFFRDFSSTDTVLLENSTHLSMAKECLEDILAEENFPTIISMASFLSEYKSMGEFPVASNTNFSRI